MEVLNISWRVVFITVLLVDIVILLIIIVLIVFIGGGIANTLGDTSGSILWTQFSSILGGRSNKIQNDGGVLYAAIVNGQSNTVTADYAAIIGGQSLTADRNSYYIYEWIRCRCSFY